MGVNKVEEINKNGKKMENMKEKKDTWEVIFKGRISD